MSRLGFVSVLLLFLCAGPLMGRVPSAFAATITVCPHCAYTAIQPALDHAANGDVIRIEAGTYSGPIVITKSVTIIGAGAGDGGDQNNQSGQQHGDQSATIIKGGGPVVTIGTLLGTSQPTVRIIGVVVTGGVTMVMSSPDPTKAAGGGVYVPPSAHNQLGATVTITDSVITNNRVGVGGTYTCPPPPPGATCSNVGGGGILNVGTVTLNNVTVSNNTVSTDEHLVSDLGAIHGGGLANGGVVTLNDSRVIDNHVNATTSTASIGRFASGGGIDNAGGLTSNGSTIRDNTVTLSNTTKSQGTFTLAIGGGLDILPVNNGIGAGLGTATVRDSLITGNTVAVTGYGSFAGSFGGGIDDDGSLTLLDSTVRNNRTSANVTSSLTSPNSFADGGGAEIDGTATITDTTFTGNSTTATSPATSGQNCVFGAGTCAAGGALAVFGSVTITDSVVTGNSARATTASGFATVQGGGIYNCISLTLRNTAVTNNTGVATGQPGSTARGGGIWNGECGGGPPHLTLTDSAITHNSVSGSPGSTVQGGGLFTTAPVTLNNTVIAHNSPDQCFGC